MSVKTLYMVGGTMGVGKTTVCRKLRDRLPDCAFLDGDWCWDMHPFQVTDATKAMVLDNIVHVLNNFLRCPAFANVVFCWVLHEQSIADGILARLETPFALRRVSLVCSPQRLAERLERDVRAGLRDAGVVARSVPRLPLYDRLDGVQLDVSDLSPQEAACRIAALGEEADPRGAR